MSFAMLCLACRSGAPEQEASSVADTVEDTHAGVATAPDDVKPLEDETRAAAVAEDAASERRSPDAAPRPEPKPLGIARLALETRGLVRRIGSEVAGARGRPVFSADGGVVAIFGERRVIFADGRDGSFLAAFEVFGDDRDENFAFAISPGGTAFALVHREHAGIVATRGDGASHPLPKASAAAFTADDSVVLITSDALATYDLAGKVRARKENDIEHRSDCRLSARGDATYVVCRGFVRGFDPTSLAWSGPERTFEDARAFVRGHLAVVDATAGARAFDLRSGAALAFEVVAEDWEELDAVFPDLRGAIVVTHRCPGGMVQPCRSHIARGGGVGASIRSEGVVDVDLSPDAKRIAVSAYEGFVLTGLGGDLVFATRARPAMSPDGRFVVKVAGAARWGELALIRLDDLSVRTVRLPAGHEAAHLAWDPASKKALVATWRAPRKRRERYRPYAAWLDAERAKLSAPFALLGAGQDAGANDNDEESFGMGSGIATDGRIVLSVQDEPFMMTVGAAKAEAFDEAPETVPTRSGIADPKGRWEINYEWNGSGFRPPPNLVPLVPELGSRGRVFEPHLGDATLLVTPDGQLVSIGAEAIAVWDPIAFLASPR